MICGFDEAGRGPLAGPVCAAAVMLPLDFERTMLRDSKKLSAPKREALSKVIYGKALAWGIGWASAQEIDRINILQASLLAMKRAFSAFCRNAAGKAALLPLDADSPATSEDALGDRVMMDRALRTLQAMGLEEGIVDGLYIPDIPLPCRSLVKADATVGEVMAASILAKTARDRVMVRYSWLYPDYGYAQHKGYPTKMHRERIAQFGPSPIQRMSFSFPSGL